MNPSSDLSPPVLRQYAQDCLDRVNRATPAPWAVLDAETPQPIIVSTAKLHTLSTSRDALVTALGIAQILSHAQNNLSCAADDATFIAHARTDVGLLALIVITLLDEREQEERG